VSVRFPAMADPTPTRVHISTRSGKVHVFAADGVDLTVDGGTMEARADGSIEVRRAHDARMIELRCPTGTDVTVGTMSGSVETAGALGGVHVVTMSGKIHIERATSVDVRTRSGLVEVGACSGECRVVATSAKVRVGSAARASVAAVSGLVALEAVGNAEVKTVSGKVLLGTTGSGRVSVKSISGTVEIVVPREIHPATRLRSISGRVECECPVGVDGEIAVKTVSGAIRVSGR